MNMTQKELDRKVYQHRGWLLNKKWGKKLTLHNADLCGADLYDVDLRGADLRRTDLRGADLHNADLYGANLHRTDLRDADLRRTDLRRTDLCAADLCDADLCDASLRGADLCGADLCGANLDFSCLPLWCGGQFKTDVKVCKQLVAHVVRIMELSNINEPELILAMNEYKAGWHREKEF